MLLSFCSNITKVSLCQCLSNITPRKEKERGQKRDEEKGGTLLSILHGLQTYLLRGCACAPPCSRL